MKQILYIKIMIINKLNYFKRKLKGIYLFLINLQKISPLLYFLNIF